VNLIGEHTDYNEGFVLPMAIERDTFVGAARRPDRRVRVVSRTEDESGEFDLDAFSGGRRHSWLDYVEGVACMLSDGGPLVGANLLIDSDVPIGAGLSSSAALEMSVGLALLGIAGRVVDRVALAKAGQRAEHEYVGMKCGLMDQLASALGQERHALLIDCRSLEAQPISADLGNVDVVICDSRVKHSLASSAYNERRQQCAEGVRLLAERIPGVTALRDVSVEAFEAHAADLPETIRKRCRHVVTEDARTLEAADAFRAGDLAGVGTLMYASHASLRDDYEVSCSELDALVDIAKATSGVIGARMTGGGFGGCTVNLVRRDELKNFEERIASKYHEATGIDVAIFVTGAGAGASELPPEALR
jgi:galactokinase